MSAVRLFFSWGAWILVLASAGLVTGPAAADEHDSPPAVPAAALLHLDSEVGDDAASGLSWDEPLRSLAEVQRRMDEGRHVFGLRLAAGWYPGSLHATRSLRVQGGFPPAGLPRDVGALRRGRPDLHRTVIDALGRSAVLTIEGGSLTVDGVVLTGGWSFEGGAVAATHARVTLTRSELVDSGPALLGCRDCTAVEISDTTLARAATAGVELFGETRTELRIRNCELMSQRRAIVSEAPANLAFSDSRLSAIERETLSLPEGSETELTRVEELSDGDSAAARPSPESVRRLAAR